MFGRAVLARDAVQMADAGSDAEYGLQHALSGAVRSMVGVPLLHGGAAIGAISVVRRQLGEFSAVQVELLRTFAAQAVIAIGSAETYRELQGRTRDLQEALEYQTATSDVLQVVSRSSGELQPVLDKLVETAARICRAESGFIFRFQDGLLRMIASFGIPAEYNAFQLHNPIAPGRGTLAGRIALEGRAVQIEDAATDPEYTRRQAVQVGNQRTMLGAPLVRDYALIGVITLARSRVDRFSDKEIALVTTFADQAVVAMENARLLTEQREALEQQTATAEVLQVINTSPGDLAPVFDTMLQKATNLCAAAFGILWTFDGDHYHAVAFRNVPDAYSEFLRDPPPATPLTPLGRIAAGEAFAQIADMADASFAAGGPMFQRAVELGGFRTIVGVPLRKDAVLLGAITIYRQEVRPFSDKQIMILQNFATQAIIAIENARLNNETREALEQQTATAEVLQVINASPGNLEPVFDAMLDKAMRLCDAVFGGINMWQEKRLRPVAVRGPQALIEYIAKNGVSLGSRDGFSRVARGNGFVQFADISTSELYRSGEPYTRALVDLCGGRTTLSVPLVKDDTVLGVLAFMRQEVKPFTDKQIALVKNFAAQAVVAMENSRLIGEQREALEQQTATAEVLQVINSSPGDLVPVFDALLENAMRLCEIAFGLLYTRDGEYFRAVAARGLPPALAEYSRHPFKVPPGSTFDELVAGVSVVQIPDVATDDRPASDARRALVELGGGRTGLAVALRKDNEFLGAFWFYRQEVRPFTEKQVALLQNFAAQAVIAMENARLLTETREALEQQTATADVLQVINASPGRLEPVFSAVIDKATRLCQAELGDLAIYDGSVFRLFSGSGLGAAEQVMPPDPGTALSLMLDGASVIHIPDIADTDEYRARVAPRVLLVEKFGARTTLWVALRKEDTLLGVLAIYRREVRPFSDKQIALLQNFAAQAVIAMENARLITETREALEQQTATAEVLQVINANPGNLIPVFDTILDKAMRLCGAAFGCMYTYDGERFPIAAMRGVPDALAQFITTQGALLPTPGGKVEQMATTKRAVQVVDLAAHEMYLTGDVDTSAYVDLGGARTIVDWPLLREGSVVGFIAIYRQEVRAFSDKEVALLENFATQAVLAMENARLLDEIRQRQEELRITFENMGDGVALFDETPRLVAWNRKFQEMLDVPDDVLDERRTYADYIRYLSIRGEYGPDVDPEAQLHHFQQRVGEHYVFERTRPDGRIIEVRHNPVPAGGFVLIYADITERKQNEAELRAARDAAEEASRTIEAAYRDLKAAQASLIQAEKMASLGQLTAGIAHEIKNPLNFVNNFATLSVDLLNELKETAARGFATLDEAQRAEIDDLTRTLSGNLEKINEHGNRADAIVRSMLEHSRGSSGERRSINLNTLVDEALNLAYHGARARDQSFNVTLQRDFGEGIAPITLVPQDITRVLVNLFANGFYAARRRQSMEAGVGFEPTLKVVTREAGDAVEIRVRDNGIGIPEEVRDKLFQPFFTTKPTGEGTGLGLSISYDIVTQQHGGSITVDSKVGEYSEFTIRLSRNP
jgi:GAF domain-containing protein/nitrogen-specific signal transduction histidine kinase